jgi:hypothetical protein
MKRAPQVVRAAAAEVVVADSVEEVAGVAIVAAAAEEEVAGDAGIAGDSNRVFTTRAAGPVGVPRFFWCAQRPMPRHALGASVVEVASAALATSGLVFRAHRTSAAISTSRAANRLVELVLRSKNKPAKGC